MQKRKKAAFLLTLLLASLLAGGLRAMERGQLKHPIISPDPIKKIKPVSRQQLRGPAYKSYRAAGRNLRLNRAARAVHRSRVTKAGISGPAYKNRRPVVDTVEVPPPTRERITGPRYKNRKRRSATSVRRENPDAAR